MGNQVPLCVETCKTCNPVCCAICVSPRRATGSDDAGQATSSKSVFANATSVLAGAAEEIHLSNSLENELAHEVELWRMETSGVDSITGLAVVQRGEPFDGRVTVPFARERSLSPPPRTQVSLHDRVGLTSGFDGGSACIVGSLGGAEEAYVHPRARESADDADAAAGAAGTVGLPGGLPPSPGGAADAAAGSPKPEASSCERPAAAEPQRGRSTMPRSISASCSVRPKRDSNPGSEEERAG